MNMIHEYDLIFYVSPEGVDIEDNGVRETNTNYRMAIDKKIKSIIQMHRSNSPIIKGTVKSVSNNFSNNLFVASGKDTSIITLLLLDK